MKKRILAVGIMVLLMGMCGSGQASAMSRIKDIARIDGVRENQLYGYGLVVGLNGTGDKQGSVYTVQSVGNMLRRLGVHIAPEDVANQIRSRNVAAVMVTAQLPPFVKPGGRIDVVVSSIGDATSVASGVLLQTPLMAADGNVYAVAQGQISTGLNAGTRTVDRGPLTVARIPSGALIEQTVPTTMVKNGTISIFLNRPDFSTAERVIQAINQGIGSVIAHASDAGTVKIDIPDDYQNNIVKLIALIEAMPVAPDAVAKVVINERTGTVVAGKDVKISTVAVTHGTISVQVMASNDYSQSTRQVRNYPPKGEQTSISNSTTLSGEGTKEMVVLDEGVDIYQLVKALNTIGVSPKDLIAILQAIKEAGALQADLEVI